MTRQIRIGVIGTGIARIERIPDLVRLREKFEVAGVHVPSATARDFVRRPCLERGLHIFCEKPLCYSAADIDDVIAARDNAGKVLQVGDMQLLCGFAKVHVSAAPTTYGDYR
jgi:predicted dehydrogenase